MAHPLVFSVARLLNFADQTHEEFDLDIDGKLISDADVLIFGGNLKGQLIVVKCDDVLLVRFDHLQVSVATGCDACLADTVYSFSDFTSEEREFFIDVPSEYKDEEVHEVFEVNMAMMTIDVREMLIQEVLMALPSPLYCAACAHVAEDIEVADPDVDKQKQSETKPFAGLKDMLQ